MTRPPHRSSREIRAVRGLNDAESLLSAIVDGSDDAIFSKDLQGNITSWNASAEDLYGYRAEEVLGQNVQMLIPDDRLGESAEIIDRVARGIRVRHFETVRCTKDGSLVEVSLTVSPVRDRSGEIVAASVVARDVSERNKAARAHAELAADMALQLVERQRAEQELETMQTELLQLQKLEAVGQLAAGIAHDFNNLLSVILSYASTLRAEVEEGSAAAEDLSEITKAAKRAAELTQQLLAFARKQVLEPTPTDLNELIGKMAQMLDRVLGEQIQLTLDLADVDDVLVDRGKLEQVLMNLVVNSRDAMPEGGTLRIETGRFDLSERAALPLKVRAGNYVHFSVSDTGHGMDDATRRRIFEPFFTTKAHKKGTGLGLSTAYGIVQQSDGFIEVETELGRGTRFRVCLPRSVAARNCEAITEEPPPPPPFRRHTVLVVDDEDAVRRAVSRSLSHRGYRVLEAADGSSALALVENRSEQIDLMLCDVVLPRESGPALAKAIRTARPDLRVAFMSGYADDIDPIRRAMADGCAFIPKPISPNELVARISKILAAG